MWRRPGTNVLPVLTGVFTQSVGQRASEADTHRSNSIGSQDGHPGVAHWPFSRDGHGLRGGIMNSLLRSRRTSLAKRSATLERQGRNRFCIRIIQSKKKGGWTRKIFSTKKWEPKNFFFHLWKFINLDSRRAFGSRAHAIRSGFASLFA